ncbi:AAA domain-containing protein [Pseudomonas sp. MH10]|uniref:AAA domain-containing protein n=1 Tax=Pseudomonas sp. MH10 TaxID=3048627 RepID=UPI002AC98817|nr:AAA domain-containing protein [Pseudomonas sp. MH10]MEB0043089.1 AAA domain-containing protein [Pseudomonas sp. MH10]WPX63240.1 AAA domain-containing protein [Pseudomonas sp. MH10]
MDIEHERLASLIEFAKQTTLMQKKPAIAVNQHNNFSVSEAKLLALPGVHLNVESQDEDHIWLRLDRLHETAPPLPENELLGVWIDLKGTPDIEPALKPSISMDELAKINALPPEGETQMWAISQGEDVSGSIALEHYPDAVELRAHLIAYLLGTWSPWAAEEKKRRKSIAQYSDFFLLIQQMQGNLGDAQLEVVWGIGVATWDHPSVGKIEYPLLTQLVEIEINEKTMAIEVRPRQTDPRLEVDAYVAAEIAGVGPLTTQTKDFFKKSDVSLNPFMPSTFDPVIRMASSLLDMQGQYVPAIASIDDRSVPKPGKHLALTDTWVLFARPRDTNLFLQDLERFEEIIEANAVLPPALQAIFTAPSNTVEDLVLPPFRGLSYVLGSHGSEANPATQKELYFPKPYNDEQVQIIQLLEVSDGVVVQGPPGTGKTHTIANVISHYLANGKRVLVTSMKDPALAVLREKLPEDIRPLAISLLSSEADGMKQFEFSIEKIAAEVQRIDRAAYKREIEQIDGEIDTLHAQISSLDREVNAWADRNLSNISIDDESISPTAAATIVSAKQEEIAWFPDELSADSCHRPQFDTQDIIALREARMQVRDLLVYLGKKVPQLNNFPDAKKLIQVHLDLAHELELQKKESRGDVPRLRDQSIDIIEEASALYDSVTAQLKTRTRLDAMEQPWLAEMEAHLQSAGHEDIFNFFLALKEEIEDAITERKNFIARPVQLTFEPENNDEMVKAVENLSSGRRPFGLTGLLGKSAQKQQLDNIQILGSKAETVEDWGHIYRFIRYQQRSRALLMRWNALAAELPLPRFETGADELLSATKALELFDLICQSDAATNEIELGLAKLIPDWSRSAQLRAEKSVLVEAENFLAHHLTRNRLAEAWAIKESFQKALAGCEGDITARFYNFLSDTLGSLEVQTTTVQAHWSELMEELRRVLEQGTALRTISEITDTIEASGAALWASQLRSEVSEGPVDLILPGNCLDIWRLRRLACHLEKIDGRKELKRLFKQRRELERDLAKLYQDAVVKRTWLRLSENATHGVRAALELYRSAIRKIGKGTGVRASRYRKDARVAAETANSAIPCWIMPHYRICESLPATFGAFDLVIIDEASQSDLSALPALLRAKKVLIVGDDKQVSPEGIGMEEDRLQGMMNRFLGNQVELYRPLMSPERSLYDLFRVVFAKSTTMLREHFRCVAPIIEYSKREFYRDELKPLRLPLMTERLDPPLIDLKVMDGVKKGKINLSEANVIVEEIRQIVNTPALNGRSIGVVSLLGAEQAQKIMQMLTKELGEEIIAKYHINCGDARTFQGKERDIMFLSMVVSAGDAHAQTRDSMKQRFNVAASRARDRMYLVRSLDLSELSHADELRRGLFQHFESPFAVDPVEVSDLRELCESGFERDVYDDLTNRGYRVIPQVPVGAFRLDMVVEGDNDSRLAIECDGDRYHGPDVWDADMRRQRILERAGWRFWRCFASAYTLRKEEVLLDLLDTLAGMGIVPASCGGVAKSIHVGRREVYGYPKVNVDYETETVVSDINSEENERASTGSR